jgi:hypothetical protein
MTKPWLNVYVVWHPEFTRGGPGEAVADQLYRTLSRDPDKPLAPELGIPVYFRTSMAPARVPVGIDLERAHHSVVVLLLDQRLSLQDDWVGYARRLANAALASKRQHLVLPVLYLSRDQAPRLGNTQHIDLNEYQPKRRPVMLQLRVMAEICRLLQDMPRGRPGDLQLSPEPVRLFLSHAKLDGENEAEGLLNKIKKTPLEAFFDKTHIASGYDFSREIRANIRHSALVVLQSDAYASRPWCRREVLEAKRHERPIVVVHRMCRGEERSFPYLGNVPTMGWTGDNHYEIMAATVREFLRKLYTEARFKHLRRTRQIPRAERHLIRPPELIDGLLFEKEVAAGTGRTRLILYPDPPLSGEETETLGEFFPAITFATPTTLAGTTNLTGTTVGISISRSDDLTDRGFGRAHYSAAMVEMARHVLARGGAIAYGGDLRPLADGGQTEQLFQLVRAYLSAGLAPLQLIVNYLAWQTHVGLDADRELELKKVARLTKVPMPKGLAKRLGLEAGKPLAPYLPAAPYIRARCLTEMRRRMNAAIDARVLMGGKITGYSVKYPGLLEEGYLALEAHKPLYLLGAFGGCTGLMIEAVRGKKVQEFEEAYQVAHSQKQGSEMAYGRLLRLYGQYQDDPSVGDGTVDYERVVRAFHEAGTAGLNNGLTSEENEELFTTENLDRIIYLMTKGMARRFG